MGLLNAMSLQMFQYKMKISLTVLSVRLVEKLPILKMFAFIYSDKRLSYNNT